MARRLLLLPVLVSVAAPRAAAAQLGATLGLEDRQAAVARVPVGEIVRLRLSGGGHAGGPVLRWNALAVTLGPYMGYAERDTFVALQSIDTLWRRTPATRRGALVGGVSGLAIGIAIGATAGSICPTAGGNQPCARGVVTSAAAGLLAGGFIGAVVGAGTPRWRRLHPHGRPALATEPIGPRVTLEAQGPSVEPDPRALALARARRGALVRLRFTNRSDLTGYVVGAGARRAIIAPTIGGDLPTTEAIALESIDGVWERGSAAPTGSVLGGLLAFGAAAYFGASGSACAPPANCTPSRLGGGLLAGVVGWIVGGRLASLVPRWQRRF